MACCRRLGERLDSRGSVDSLGSQGGVRVLGDDSVSMGRRMQGSGLGDPRGSRDSQVSMHLFIEQLACHSQTGTWS